MRKFRVVKLLPAILIPLFLLVVLPTLALAQRATVADKIETRRETIASKAAERMATLEERKALFATRREAHASAAATRKDALRDKFKAFKDQKRVTIAKRLDNNLGKLNDNRTSAMLTHLDRMDAFLTRIEARAATASAEGKDVTLVTTAISAAKEAVATARDGVESQAVKDYTIEATSEAKLKEDFKATRDSLHLDLTAVHQQILDAKKLVVSAVQALEGVLSAP